MATRTRLNVYFDPELLKQVRALSLRRKVSQSTIVEAAVASFLSGDSTDRLEAAISRRMDRLGRQIDTLDDEVSILGETVSLFIRFWLAVTPPLPEGEQSAARAKGAERFEGFMHTLGKRLATGDRFLRELSRDMPPESPADPMDRESATMTADPLNNPS